jgi:MFS family permease
LIKRWVGADRVVLEPTTSKRTLVIAVSLTLLAQTLLSMALLGPAVIAPEAARSLGVATERIGIFVALNYLIAMVSGLAGPYAIARWQATRVCQLALLAGALGLGVGTLSSLNGSMLWIVLSSVCLGFGYGVLNPVTSHIIVRVAPPSMLALIFSIKQTGVPLGGVLAGALLPSLALARGWPFAILAVAVACALLALVCQFTRPEIDGADHASADSTIPAKVLPAFSLALIIKPLRLVQQSQRLRDIAMVSTSYAAVQMVLFTYLVAYANIELGYSLVSAGVLYSVTQIAGVSGRIIWGAIADRMRRPLLLLGLLGVMSCLMLALLAAYGANWSWLGLSLFCVVLGAVAIGWNGIYLAEVARGVPKEQVGAATGGAQFFTFFGALGGPALASVMITASGHYALAMAVLGVFALITGVRVMRRA